MLGGDEGQGGEGGKVMRRKDDSEGGGGVRGEKKLRLGGMKRCRNKRELVMSAKGGLSLQLGEEGGTEEEEKRKRKPL